MNVLAPRTEQTPPEAAAPGAGKSPLAPRGCELGESSTAEAKWAQVGALEEPQELPGLGPKAGRVPLTDTPRAQPCRAASIICTLSFSFPRHNNSCFHHCCWIKPGHLRGWRKTGSNRAQCGIFALKAELYGLRSPLHLRQAHIYQAAVRDPRPSGIFTERKDRG